MRARAQQVTDRRPERTSCNLFTVAFRLFNFSSDAIHFWSWKKAAQTKGEKLPAREKQKRISSLPARRLQRCGDHSSADWRAKLMQRLGSAQVNLTSLSHKKGSGGCSLVQRRPTEEQSNCSSVCSPPFAAAAAAIDYQFGGEQTNKQRVGRLPENLGFCRWPASFNGRFDSDAAAAAAAVVVCSRSS